MVWRLGFLGLRVRRVESSGCSGFRVYSVERSGIIALRGL